MIPIKKQHNVFTSAACGSGLALRREMPLPRCLSAARPMRPEVFLLRKAETTDK